MPPMKIAAIQPMPVLSMIRPLLDVSGNTKRRNAIWFDRGAGIFRMPCSETSPPAAGRAGPSIATPSFS